MNRVSRGLTTGVTIFLLGSLAQAKSPADKVWVIVRPVQCLGNPWEKDWLIKNKNKASNYPRAQEFQILKSFFARKKIPILDLRVKQYVKGDMLCQACDCPRGDTVFLMIPARHVPNMIQLGYTERMPADSVPQIQK